MRHTVVRLVDAPMTQSPHETRRGRSDLILINIFFTSTFRSWSSLEGVGYTNLQTRVVLGSLLEEFGKWSITIGNAREAQSSSAASSACRSHATADNSVLSQETSACVSPRYRAAPAGYLQAAAGNYGCTCMWHLVIHVLTYQLSIHSRNIF
jgi:hypothetical protein